jgi:hypothetical protein
VSATALSLTADQVVAKLVESNAARTRQLQSYSGRRIYSLDYKGLFGHKQATIEVTSKFTGPATKEFTIVSESGSKMLVNKVLKGLLEGEKEAAAPDIQRQTALTPDNYKFSLLGTATRPSGDCYRLRADPLRENKFLYRGEICVDARDFAVVSIEAEPAKNPSFWISSTRIEHAYGKVGQFWLPSSNKSTSKVKLGGSAVLTILYTDYKIE